MKTLSETNKKETQSKNRNSNTTSRSDAAKHAAKTRKDHDPQAFSKMGQKGGSHSPSSGDK